MSQLKNQLAEAAHQKKSQQLKAWEQELAEKEAIVDRQLADLKITEQKIKIKQKSLNALDAQIAEKHTTYDKLTQDANVELNTIEASVRRSENKLEDLIKTESVIKTSVNTLMIQSDGLKTSITENKDYLKQQERIVENTVADWNSNLVGFQHDADGIEDSKRKLLQDVVRIEQDKTALLAETELLGKKVEQLDYSYEEKARDYRSSLKQLQADVDRETNILQTIINEQIIAEKSLATREKAIKIQEVVFLKREKDLDMKERRLRSSYAIAQKVYE